MNGVCVCVCVCVYVCACVYAYAISPVLLGALSKKLCSGGPIAVEGLTVKDGMGWFASGVRRELSKASRLALVVSRTFHSF